MTRLLPLALVAALARVAAAQPDPYVDDFALAPALETDYEVASERWNGLSTLAALTRGLGYRFAPAESLDWTDIDSDDILFILYPTERVPPGHLAAFVRNGGRLLLADDFGDSSEAMARLGMIREETRGVDAETFHDDLAYAPVARPWLPAHPLAAGVDGITTNHPAVLTRTKGPEVVFGFGAGEGVVAAGSLGSGLFVVVSDPSLFINRMLQFPGNFRFATNVLRFLSREDTTRRVVVVTGDYRVYGEPSGLLDDGTVDGTVKQMVSDVNNWLEERNDYLLTRDGLRVISVAAAILISLLGLALLPMARRSRLDGGWTRTQSTSLVVDDYQSVVAAFDRHGHRGNYLLPAAVVRDGLNARLARLLEQSQPLYTLREAELYGAVEREAGPAAATALRHTYRRLKALPSRLQAASTWSHGFLSRREFERLHDDIHALYRYLDAGTQRPGGEVR
jgi:hypothetical protein